MNIFELPSGPASINIKAPVRYVARRSKVLTVRIKVGGKLGHMRTVPAGIVQLKCPHKGCYKPDGHAPKTHGTQASQHVKGGIRATR